MRRFVSASELAHFTYCEQQWALERHLQFDEMTDRQLARIVQQGQRSADPSTRARGGAAAEYVHRVRPALHRGERYHTKDARRRRGMRPHPLIAILAILAMLLLLALSLR